MRDASPAPLTLPDTGEPAHNPRAHGRPPTVAPFRAWRGSEVPTSPEDSEPAPWVGTFGVPSPCVAERVGFEPTVHLLGRHTISSRAPSAARSPLQSGKGLPAPHFSLGALVPTKLVGNLPRLPSLETWPIAPVPSGNVAESEGFEPPVPLPVHLISSQAPSTSSASSPRADLADFPDAAKREGQRLPPDRNLPRMSRGFGPGRMAYDTRPFG